MSGYRNCAVVLTAVLVLAAALALIVEDDRWDSVLGGVTGASTALLRGCLLCTAAEHRRRRDEADAASLDRLEPLRADHGDGA